MKVNKVFFIVWGFKNHKVNGCGRFGGVSQKYEVFRVFYTCPADMEVSFFFKDLKLCLPFFVMRGIFKT